MITRKRYRDNCEVNKLLSSSLCLRTIVKKTSSSKGSSNNPAPKRPKMSMDFSRFLLLLEEVCNGHHKEKISCVDVMTDCFWLEFAAVWNSRTPKNLNLDGETCEKVAKRLKALHTKMENPDVYPGSKSVKGAATLKPKLDNVFNHHDELFAVWGLEQVPETPPYQIYKGTTSARVSVSMQKTSTTSSIDQESITAIEVAMKELVDKRFLNYVDLQDAEQYLYMSKLAANTFLSEHDLKKRCDLIRESNAAWREKSVDMKWMRNKRQ